jgi:hypothetical protein
MVDIKVLKQSLVEYTGGETLETKRFISYVDTINKKDKKGTDLSFGMSIQDMIKIYAKCATTGITLDGINGVFTGYNRVFITWVGYKNKVLSVYPESEFDTQLVRESDITSFAKESGSVVYSHTISNPFDSNKGIIGAYCVIKNKRGEFLETLGKDDFEKMKAASLVSSTWDKWESEFWLKSVIKRACKRHFNDIVSDIEIVDNQDYDTNHVSQDIKDEILKAHGNDS